MAKKMTLIKNQGQCGFSNIKEYQFAKLAISCFGILVFYYSVINTQNS